MAETKIELKHGGYILFIQDEFGEEIRRYDKDGNEIVMWENTEWEEDPTCVVPAIMGCMAITDEECISRCGRTVVEDGCWI